MRKLFFGLAVAAGLGMAGSSARADFGGGPPGLSTMPAGTATGAYGWNPIVKKMFWWKKSDDCATCGTGHAGKHGKGVYMLPEVPGLPTNMGITGMPANMPGTLVFPNHTFLRSPRDYFMYGQGGN